MMKIAILSDSHKKVSLTRDAVDFLVKSGASYFIHAGDLELEDNLKILKETKKPYVSVFGNNDSKLFDIKDKYNIYKEPHFFNIKDISFKLMHLPFYLNADANIVVSGHTHEFDCQYINGTLFLNPGEICAREKDISECVMLEITENEYVIEYNYRKFNEKLWNTKIIKYDRK